LHGPQQAGDVAAVAGHHVGAKVGRILRYHGMTVKPPVDLADDARDLDIARIAYGARSRQWVMP
jgi:hypothetical protein